MCHPSVTSLPGPSTKYDPRTLSTLGEERVDTAYSNLVGPSDVADLWGDKGGKKVRTEVLRAWIGTGKRKGRGSTRRRVDEGEDAVPEENTDEHGLVAGPSRLASTSAIAPKTSKRYARSENSGESSDEGGSDDHARTAWKLFGAGELVSASKTWVSPSPQSQAHFRAEAVVDMGMLPTPTSSPLLHGRRLEGSRKGKERAIGQASLSDLSLATPDKAGFGRAPTEIVLPVFTPEPFRLTSFVSACTSPFVSFGDVRFSDSSLEEYTKEVVGSDLQPFSCLDNVVLSDPSRDLVSSPHLTQHQSQSQQVSRLHRGNLSITKDIGNVVPERNTKNVDEAPPLKRRRMDGEETEVKMDEKGDAFEVVASKLGQLQSMSTPCGQDEVCDLPHKSSTELTRTPTIPFVTSMVDEEASIPSTSSALEVEGVLGAEPRSSPAPVVTATPTLSFPVRKHIEDRPNRIGKASLTAPRPNT